MKNIVCEILDIITYIRVERAKSTTITTHNEILDDITGQLSTLMSSCLSAPIQGRMHLALPQAYLPLEEQQQSLNDQKTQFYDMS